MFDKHRRNHVVGPSDVGKELGKILASPVFANSPRMTQFLKFVVEETLEGNSGRIKEYVIAIEVFDKRDDYDPQVDSTVRTEASKLRSRLSRYYETEGREDPVVISIPKGSYVPVFEDGRKAAPATPPRTFLRLRVAAVALAAVVAVAGNWIWQTLRQRPLSAKLVPLTSYPELEEHPSLSPDGSQVAFSWKGDIHVKEVEGDGIAQVTKHPAVEAAWPSWSPDGRQIAFVRQGDVFLVSPLGGAERRVTESLGRAVWTPDGSALLVTLKTSPYARSIFLISLANGEKRRLTFPNDMSPGDRDGAVSPDGQTVAFSRGVQAADIYVVPIAGGEARRLTNDHRDILGLAWTPDGREVVFSSRRTGWIRLWRVPARPAERPGSFVVPRQVEHAGDGARYPWIAGSAKGGLARLVYQQYNRNFDIRRAAITGVEGSRGHILQPSSPLIDSTRADFMPAFSPDGKKIAFGSDRSGARELWICEMDGTNPVRLTSFAGADVILPRWSPDGQRLIFSALTGPNGNFESYILGAGGGTPQRISTPEVRSIAHPIFSRDGRWVYFIPGPMEGNVNLWRIPSAGGKAVQITTNGAFRPEESPDGKLIYYGKAYTNGLWSIAVKGGEEGRVLDSITGHNWSVASKGIYYFDFAVPPGAPKLVKFYSFETSKVSQVGTVESTVSAGFSGISVSPDGRWLLYSHIATTSSDLMLVDGFR
jgi:Tol biopolymer transport system component